METHSLFVFVRRSYIFCLFRRKLASVWPSKQRNRLQSYIGAGKTLRTLRTANRGLSGEMPVFKVEKFPVGSFGGTIRIFYRAYNERNERIY